MFSVSTTSVAVSWIARIAITVAIIASVALIAMLVMYFQEITIPTLVMAVSLYGLPAAFILGGVVVTCNIRQRRRD